MHTVSLAILLMVFWLLNSGHYTPLLLFFMLLSVALVIWIARRMDVVDHESQPLHLTMLLPSYYAWLLKEIVLANIDVVKRVIRGPSAISPVMARVPVTQNSDMGRVIYANSITLTPGTVAIDLEDEYVLVHALSREGMRDLQGGEMARRVDRLESREA